MIANQETPSSLKEFCPLNSTSTSYESNRVIKNSPGVLYAITGYNSGSNTFIQIHDSTILPTEGATPVVIFNVPSNSSFNYSADKFGRYFSNGIVVCNSSTATTKTIGGNTCWFDIQYY